MAKLREHANTSDAFLEQAWEGRERDELPAEPPMTDEEIQAMHDYFHPPLAASPLAEGDGA